MRCKACNVTMIDEELKTLDSLTLEVSELCTDCLGESDGNMYIDSNGSVDGYDYQFGDDLPTFEGFNENSDY